MPVSSVWDVVTTAERTRKITKHKMLHWTRENCDSKVILLVVAVEVKVEAFVVVAAAIFLTNRKSDVQGLYLETGVQDYSTFLLPRFAKASNRLKCYYYTLSLINFPDFSGPGVYNREKRDV